MDIRSERSASSKRTERTGAVPATATSVTLAWTTNSINETGFYLDRATDPNFTKNLITQTLPAGINSYTDTASGLAPGSTFYYRIRAFNLAGSSANSNVAGVTIPLAPPKPTDAIVENVTTNEIALSWNDNSGPLATYFDILRSVNNGVFIDYLHLPPTSVVQGGTIPAGYDWTDTGVSPGNLYKYNIEAVNSSGHNDFVGANAETITLPPTNLTAVTVSNGISLTWTAPQGTVVSYNLYRGTSPGEEGTTPLATGITSTTYLDNSAIPGVAILLHRHRGQRQYQSCAGAALGKCSLERNIPVCAVCSNVPDGEFSQSIHRFDLGRLCRRH